jgi:hypothetical protein
VNDHIFPIALRHIEKFAKAQSKVEKRSLPQKIAFATKRAFSQKRPRTRQVHRNFRQLIVKNQRIERFEFFLNK